MRAFHSSVLVLICVSWLAPAQTDNLEAAVAASPPAKQVVGQHLKARGIPNFGEVTPTLYRGGLPSKEGFKTLARMGIAIVINTSRSKREEKLVKRLGMSYVTIPWHCPFPRDELFARFLKITQENRGSKIFVHCRLGDDRTGMMIAAYRMGVQHWSAEEAMQEMHEFGYGGIHHLICPGLGRYERSFPRRLRSSPAFRELELR